MNTLVIMPTYNEALNLEHSVGDLFEHNPSVRLLIVDDNSPDGTGEIADRLAASDERISVMHSNEKSGLAGAYKAGFAWGIERGFDHLVEMDADGSQAGYDTEMIKIARSHTSLPIIASGGAGALTDFPKALTAGANALLAASIFHFGQFRISQVKAQLAKDNYPVRV